MQNLQKGRRIFVDFVWVRHVTGRARSAFCSSAARFASFSSSQTFLKRIGQNGSQNGIAAFSSLWAIFSNRYGGSLAKSRRRYLGSGTVGGVVIIVCLGHCNFRIIKKTFQFFPARLYSYHPNTDYSSDSFSSLSPSSLK